MNLSQGGRSTSWYHDDPNPFGITQQHTVSKLKKVQKMMNWKWHNGMEYRVHTMSIFWQKRSKISKSTKNLNTVQKRRDTSNKIKKSPLSTKKLVANAH